MSDRRVPGGLATTRLIAGVTLLRLVRGRAPWVSLLIGALPVAYAVAMKSAGALGVGTELFTFSVLVVAVLAPMFLGASIGEEIEDRTTTYLWSRPVPRWTVLAGKLVALTPVILVVVLAGWTCASLVAWGELPTIRTCAALAAGAVALALVTMGITTVGPRHGTALTICYMLFFDFPTSVLPVTLQNASIAYQVNALSGLSGSDDAVGPALLALALVGGVWTVVAAVRIRRLEA